MTSPLALECDSRANYHFPENWLGDWAPTQLLWCASGLIVVILPTAGWMLVSGWWCISTSWIGNEHTLRPLPGYYRRQQMAIFKLHLLLCRDQHINSTYMEMNKLHSFLSILLENNSAFCCGTEGGNFHLAMLTVPTRLVFLFSRSLVRVVTFFPFTFTCMAPPVT